jgi:hypothetical protein
MPAAPMSSLGYGMEHQGMTRAQRVRFERKLDFRQTIVPIFLTMGVLFLIIPVLKFVVDPEAGLATLLAPLWVVILLVLFGLAMLTFGVLTMFEVKTLLATKAALPVPAKR